MGDAGSILIALYKKDAKMISKQGKVLLAQLHLLKPILKSFDLEASRKTQDALAKLGARALREKVVYSKEEFSDFEAEWALPLEQAEPGVILYLHGGSYTAGTLAYAKSFGGILADNTRRPTLCAAYRLAPEYPFPAALDDAVSAYIRMLDKYPSQKVFIIGESAGGGLSYALALKIKELCLEKPGGIVAISPWTDLTLSSNSCTENADYDYPSIDLVRESAQLYSEGDLKNPLISPAFADLSGLPPSLIYAGQKELIVDDSIAMAARLESYGSPCEFHIVEDMWHAFVLFGIPESKEALKRIKEFIGEQTADDIPQ